jgi:DNA gyrase subunit A
MAADKIIATVEDQIRTSYIDYAMSVIVGRALPDVRDGLKPVHRRVLFSMHELKNTWQTAYKKSARIVGDVIGKYHPHGDQAVYDTIVRMAQEFSMRYPLVDGQGNFGSVDGDPAAAMRYTEIRMERLAGEVLADLDKETVDFADNYDGSLKEPIVMPARFPNLLVNGSSGIAVGMATNIPPHNMGEVIDATLALIADPAIAIEELMRLVPGPDFPTGGYIFGIEGIRSAYRTGRGLVRMRAKASIERNERTDREAIIVSELPYQVNKARLIEKIAELIRDKAIEGISDIRDESDRDGMRIVIEIKRDAIARVVLNSLFAHTAMQSTFGVIMLAIVAGQPKVLNLKEMLESFVDHRRDVVTRRTVFELRKAEERAHLLEGFVKALDHLDAIIELIRASKDPEEARDRLVAEFSFSARQAQAILDLRLHRLTAMERDKILEEYREILKEIERLKNILADEKVLMKVIADELVEIKTRYNDPRRTEIVPQEGEISIEDLIADEDMVVTVSREGYIKRASVSLYRAQHRGGKGKKGMATKEEDLVVNLFVASNHTNLLIFTNAGKAYQIKVYDVPMAGRTAKGKPIVNLIPVEQGELVRSILPIREFKEESTLLFVTKRGVVRRTETMAFSKIRSSGIIAMLLQEGDDLIQVEELHEAEHVLLVTRDGMSIRFPGDDLRILSRATQGVRGISLREGDEVVGCCIIGPESGPILSVTENGYGKRTDPDEYRIQNRGGLGIITIKVNERNGHVVGVLHADDDAQLMLVTDQGKIIRTLIKEISIIGRNTQGVRLIVLDEGEKVVAVEHLVEKEEEEEEVAEGEEAPTGGRFHSPHVLRRDEQEADLDSEEPAGSAEGESPETGEAPVSEDTTKTTPEEDE